MNNKSVTLIITRPKVIIWQSTEIKEEQTSNPVRNFFSTLDSVVNSIIAGSEALFNDNNNKKHKGVKL